MSHTKGETMPTPRYVLAAQVREGDMIDLEGDPFARDEDGTLQLVAECELFTVIDTEQETDKCVRIDFEGYSIGFPPGHPLRVER